MSRSQKRVAATHVHVSVMSSRFDLSEVPGETQRKTVAKPVLRLRDPAGSEAGPGPWMAQRRLAPMPSGLLVPAAPVVSS